MAGGGGPSAASMASAMRPQQGGADASAFMHAYQQGPKQHGPMASMPLHVQQQQQAAQQRAMQQMAAQRMIQPQQQSRPMQPGGGGPDFADQFMAMELQHKQQKEFEQIFAGGQPQQHHGADLWAMDFAAKEAQHRQQHLMAAQSQQAMMRAQAAQHQHSQHTSHWGRTGMHGGMMMGGGYAGGMGMYAPHMQQQMHMGPSSIAAQQQRSSVQIQEVPDSTAAGPQAASAASAQAEEDDAAEDNLYAEAATDNEFEEAYRNATGYGSQADWGSQYNADAHPPQQESSMAGGMSKAMLDDLMKSDNPKWRHSKFLKFIDKISKGEIEFKDNQAIDKGPQPQRTQGSEEWAGEYAQNAAQLGAEWADQFSTQKHHPASWGDSAASASSSSASAQAAMAEGQNADEQWLEDYAASGEADTEFRDFDWAAALAKAKESIPERKDPSYAFTDASANPLMGTDPSLAFDRGVKLFHEGKLTEAILAFESVVQSVPDHADAWSYLGEAQAHNEEENNAIAAFLKCVSIDPYNLKALLQLGVSYTNDLEESRALNYLKTWLQNNPDYQSASLTQAKQQAEEFAQLYGSNKNNGMYSCQFPQPPCISAHAQACERENGL